MKEYYFLFLLVSLHVAQCLIPSLIVKKLDKTLIARKRQDTMDMCRIFTEENNKINHNHAPKIIKSYRPEKQKIRYKRDNNEDNLSEIAMFRRASKEVPDEKDMFVKESHKNNNRYKRGATMKYAVNPALNPEDARRVENIVDRLYDDMEEKGQRFTYRQVPTTSSIRVNRNKTLRPSRRFDFAPALLMGPHSHLKKTYEPDDGPFESKARWKRGIVPYFIDFRTYDAHLSEVIVKAFDYVEKATCIRLQKLREKPIDVQSLETVPWLYISNPTGIRQCVHSNEKLRVDGVLMAVFGYDCMTLGDIVHEVMHILGFSHEHLRSDRDQHISILWENIKPGYKKYFDLNIVGSEYELESLPYDYTSILHYPPRAFSKNGKATILTEPGIKIGQRDGLSEIDVEKIALIYSSECVIRNREYLLQTCPSVVKSSTKPVNITQKQIENYFKERLWPFGIINFRFRDKMEFTIEERENIQAVFRHIKQETCIEFRDVGSTADDEDSIENHVAIIADKEKKEQEIDKMGATSSAPESLDTPQLSSEQNGEDEEVEDKEEEEEEGEEAENEDVDEEVEEEVVEKEGEVKEPGTDDLEPDDETSIVVDPVETTSGDIENNTIDPYDDEDIKNPEIAVNKKTRIEIGREGKIKLDGNNNMTENKILKTDKILGAKALEFKNMNLTMKKELLKRAKKNKQKRHRRDTSSIPQNMRRHANAVLVLKRSPELDCKCPEPGTPQGDQVLSIGAGCFNSVNDLLHFFVHVLGLDHQHNMHDRDNYLHIVWDNLTSDIRLEMQNKLPPAASAGFSYDYQSVMHYPWLQIKNGKTNIMYPIWNDGWAMGHWQGLSSVDVQKLNLLYFGQCLERQKLETLETQ